MNDLLESEKIYFSVDGKTETVRVPNYFAPLLAELNLPSPKAILKHEAKNLPLPKSNKDQFARYVLTNAIVQAKLKTVPNADLATENANLKRNSNRQKARIRELEEKIEYLEEQRNFLFSHVSDLRKDDFFDKFQDLKDDFDLSVMQAIFQLESEDDS